MCYQNRTNGFAIDRPVFCALGRYQTFDFDHWRPLPTGHDHSNALGYVGIANKALEIWLPDPRFQKIAGGARSPSAET
jgi:hypothetical protein